MRRRGFGAAALLGFVLLVIVGLGALLVTTLTSGAETQTFTSFQLCGERFELRDGYKAYDFGSQPMEEVPVGQRVLHVRSMEVGASLPVSPSAIFEVWPDEVASLISEDAYQEWLEAMRSDDESEGSRFRSEYAEVADGCAILLSLGPRTSTLLPRSDTWSISILESDL